MPFDFAYVKQHPYLIGGIALAGAVGLYIVMRNRGGSSSAAVQSGIDPTTAALYGQSQQINGQLQLAQLQANAQGTSVDATKTVDLAQIAANADVNTKTIAAQLQESANALTNSEFTTSAQLQGLENNNLTSEHLATTTANEQLGLAGITANVQLAQTEVNREQVAYNNQLESAIVKQSSSSSGGGIAGIAAGLITAII